MMKNLILIGAGAWGLEVFSWIKDAQGSGERFRFKGFLDSKLERFDEGHFCQAPILGSALDYSIQPNDIFVCTIGDPSVKKQVVEDMLMKGAEFTNLIHSSVIEFQNIAYGSGIIVSPNCVISNNVKIKSHVSINLFCSIGHDAVIGEYSVLSSHCDVTGGVIVGNEVMLGSRVTIIPSVSIIDGAVLGAGSVIMRSIKQKGTYIGNPAMKLL
jgi:sugar O-acyltransferase (sialic acid O-acetyltransferase NeuD family)